MELSKIERKWLLCHIFYKDSNFWRSSWIGTLQVLLQKQIVQLIIIFIAIKKSWENTKYLVLVVSLTTIVEDANDIEGIDLTL